MQLFEGKIHAEKLDAYLQQVILKNSPKGKLLILLIGDNPASVKYTGIKVKLCEKLGIPVQLEKLSQNLSDDEIYARVKNLFDDPSISGGLIQLPLPRPSLNKIIALIPPHKDVDLISSTRIQQFESGDFSYLPPVVRAFNYYFLTSALGVCHDIGDYVDISKSLQYIKEEVKKYQFYVIGNGLLVGKPISQFLYQLGARITVDENYHKGTNIYSDFLILGTGVPKLVVGDNISAKCNVIDFGTGVLDEKVAGDLDVTSNLDHLNFVSLSPGGIGPVVVRFLLANFLA
jgi:methylenetetrahydrofolate dehydrogenase (NADP+) / methenyltetrahydrofolate cyclohydrolase